jgi:hypothetical protein
LAHPFGGLVNLPDGKRQPATQTYQFAFHKHFTANCPDWQQPYLPDQKVAGSTPVCPIPKYFLQRI